MRLQEKDIEKLTEVCQEIRTKIIDVVLKNGGHLASNLGVVELTVALKKVFNSETDKILFDVGHQSYVYKILTEREEKFSTLRTKGGLGPFLDPEESSYDNFISGHAGSALSAGLGLAVGQPNDRIIVVVGDASIANGHSLEALNNMVDIKNMVVILNDNEMSIGQNVGWLSKVFSKMILSRTYLSLRKDIKNIMEKKEIGKKIGGAMKRAEHSIKNFFLPISITENIGFKYFGVVDGHNLDELLEVFTKVKNQEGPILIHVKTQKGRGYEPAENEQEKYHGVSPYSPVKLDKSKIYSDIVGEKLVELARKDEDVIGISAGMIKGTGLGDYFKEFPNRSFDIGITEGHGVTFAGGLAKSGKKPYFAVYSTFLQRGVGQLIHDISLQNLPIRLLIDRAGLVGEDGKTHHGLYDISLFSTLSNFILLSPTTEKELNESLDLSLNITQPMAIRYPKEKPYNIEGDGKLEIGKWREIIKGETNLFIATGSMLKEIMNVREILKERNLEGTIVSAGSILPIDVNYIENNFKNYKNIFVLEEGYEVGGLGSIIVNYLNDKKIKKHVNKIAIDQIKVPHGKRGELLKDYGLSGVKLVDRIEGKLDG